MYHVRLPHSANAVSLLAIVVPGIPRSKLEFQTPQSGALTELNGLRLCWHHTHGGGSGCGYSQYHGPLLRTRTSADEEHPRLRLRICLDMAWRRSTRATMYWQILGWVGPPDKVSGVRMYKSSIARVTRFDMQVLWDNDSLGVYNDSSDLPRYLCGLYPLHHLYHRRPAYTTLNTHKSLPYSALISTSSILPSDGISPMRTVQENCLSHQ